MKAQFSIRVEVVGKDQTDIKISRRNITTTESHHILQIRHSPISPCLKFLRLFHLKEAVLTEAEEAGAEGATEEDQGEDVTNQDQVGQTTLMLPNQHQQKLRLGHQSLGLNPQGHLQNLPEMASRDAPEGIAAEVEADYVVAEAAQINDPSWYPTGLVEVLNHRLKTQLPLD